MKLTIKTFNWVFWTLIFITIGCSLLFRTYYIAYGFEKARNLFYLVHILGVAYYFRYKIALVKDKEYDQILKDNNLPAEDIWVEIFPLQLCNVSYILIPLGLFEMTPSLLAYAEIAIPFCVVLALLMPITGLSNDTILKPRIAGFYITHLYMLYMSLCCWYMQVKTLSYWDAMGGVGIIFLVSIVAHFTNKTIKKKGLSDNANYMFTVHHNGNPVLKKLWEFNPKEFIYLLPLYPLVYALFMSVVFVTRLIF